MDLKNDDASVSTDSNNAQAGPTSAGEIDLYGELTAFAELSPEEQLRLVDRPEQAFAETESTSDKPEEHPLPEPILTQAPIEPVEADTTAAEMEMPSAEEAEQHTSSEPVPEQAAIELVEADTAAAETEMPSAEEAERHTPGEPVPEHAPIELVETEMAVAEIETPPAEEAEEHTPGEPVPEHAPIELVEAAMAVAEIETPPTEEAEQHTPGESHPPIEPVERETTVTESASLSQNSNAYVETSKVSPPVFEGSRPSGPLSGFSLTPEFVFTGALSKGVCLACGAESGADDLFCMTCGGFIDEIASALPVSPVCDECKERISADEIFCPWCGSSLPAA